MQSQCLKVSRMTSLRYSKAVMLLQVICDRQSPSSSYLSLDWTYGWMERQQNSIPIRCEVVSVPAMNNVKNYSISCTLVKPYSVSISFRSISIFSRVPSYALLSCKFLRMASLTIARNREIYQFTSRSSSKRPSFKTPCPNIKVLRVRSCVPTFPTSFYRNTDSSMFCRLSSKLSPKKDFTTVLPAILELNSMELMVNGEVMFGSAEISSSCLSTIEMILGTKVSKKEKWKIELIIFLFLAQSLPSAKTRPSPKILILFSMKNLSFTQYLSFRKNCLSKSGSVRMTKTLSSPLVTRARTLGQVSQATLAKQFQSPFSLKDFSARQKAPIRGTKGRLQTLGISLNARIRMQGLQAYFTTRCKMQAQAAMRQIVQNIQRNQIVINLRIFQTKFKPQF